jgi:uncharacterized RDD family membrane protein YckC
MSSLPAGWYKDPADPATQRYWDGEGWIGQAIAADATPPAGPPQPATEPALVPRQPTTPAAPAPEAPQQVWTAPPGWPPPPPGWTPPPGWHPPPGFTLQARPHGFPLAGMGARFVARLIDFVAVLLLNVLVNGYLGYQWWLEMEPVLRAVLDDPLAPAQPTPRSQYLVLTMLFVATALWLAYEVPGLGNSGQTPGKRIMRIKVVAVESTDRLGFGRAFRRWGRLGMWTPLWGCWGFGLLMQAIDSISPLFDQKLRQALHDRSARTVVVALPPGYRAPATAAGGGTPSEGEK